MSKSEVERHKMWEHPVPVSPFEERPASNEKSAESEEIHKLTSDVAIGGISSSDTVTTTGGTRRVPFRPDRI